MIVTNIYESEKDAHRHFEEFLGENRNMLCKVSYKSYFVAAMRNCDEVIFIGEQRYYQWCKGRTDIIGGRKYHSGYEVNEWENI